MKLDSVHHQMFNRFFREVLVKHASRSEGTNDDGLIFYTELHSILRMQGTNDQVIKDWL